MNDVLNFIKQNNLGEIKENVSFRDLTTYKTGGVARCVFYPNNEHNLKVFLSYIKDKDVLYKIFGNGSNILASDNDYNGIIIKLKNFDSLEINGNVITVGAGYNLAKLANELSRKSMTGLEFACGIPGTIGGAVYMNAGAYLKAISDILIEVKCLDKNFNVITFRNEELDFSYRHSMFINNDFVILEAKFLLKYGKYEEIIDLINSRRERRINSQPLQYPSAGSVFRNPDGEFAGHLIEEAGLKGIKKGGAEISGKHANFIINKDSATSSDIKYLMELAQAKVKEKYNIDLIREQELFNWE